MELPACALMLREKCHRGPELLEGRGVCKWILISSLPQNWGEDIKEILAGLLEGYSWHGRFTWTVQYFVGAGFYVMSTCLPNSIHSMVTLLAVQVHGQYFPWLGVYLIPTCLLT